MSQNKPLAVLDNKIPYIGTNAVNICHSRNPNTASNVEQIFKINNNYVLIVFKTGELKIGKITRESKVVQIILPDQKTIEDSNKFLVAQIKEVFGVCWKVFRDSQGRDSTFDITDYSKVYSMTLARCDEQPNSVEFPSNKETFPPLPDEYKHLEQFLNATAIKRHVGSDDHVRVLLSNGVCVRVQPVCVIYQTVGWSEHIVIRVRETRAEELMQIITDANIYGWNRTSNRKTAYEFTLNKLENELRKHANIINSEK